MDLKNLIVEDTSISAEHPLLEGFVVNIGFISKDKTRKMLEKATTTKFNKRTHKPEEDVDNDIFLKMYSKALIKSWVGLKYSYLIDLLPVDLSSVSDLDQEMEYSEENALDLLKNSPDFDGWISSVAGDIKKFNTNK